MLYERCYTTEIMLYERSLIMRFKEMLSKSFDRTYERLYYTKITDYAI